MNPAALKANIGELPPGATIIANTDAFEERNLEKAGYNGNPLEDGTLAAVPGVPGADDDAHARGDQGARREAARRRALEELLRARPDLLDVHPPDRADHRVDRREVRDPARSPRREPRRVQGGLQLRRDRRAVRPPTRSSRRTLRAGRYRNITGNVALAYGLIAAAQLAKLPILYASYPITPASDILHELSKHKNFGVRTMQAEDEIAAIGVAIGGAFAGQLGVTATSGPGVDLKAEALGLAISLELPLVIVDVQRGGPSTGLPTKTEQADLLLAMYGRHGEAPLPIVAAKSPSDCFDAAFEAVRLALKYRTPVILLTDGYLANGSEPWRSPTSTTLPDISVPFATEPNHDGEFWPYLRDPETLARPWAIPGTPGLMHRIGGIEKQDGTGQRQLRPGEPRAHGPHPGREDRAASRTTSRRSRSTTTATPTCSSSAGAAPGARSARRCAGSAPTADAVAHAHLTHLNPFPRTSARCSPATRRCSCPR